VIAETNVCNRQQARGDWGRAADARFAIDEGLTMNWGIRAGKKKKKKRDCGGIQRGGECPSTTMGLFSGFSGGESSRTRGGEGNPPMRLDHKMGVTGKISDQVLFPIRRGGAGVYSGGPHYLGFMKFGDKRK